MSGTLLIWDADEPAPAGDWTVVLWSGFDASGRDAVSMPRLVEQNAGALRAAYLAWMHDLGQRVINGRRIVNHLELTPGFSYWWMTLLSHKPNYYEAAQITDVIKCLAFESFAKGRAVPAVIRLRSARAGLRTVFERYCVVNGIRCEIEAAPAQASPARAGAEAPAPRGRPWWTLALGLLGSGRRSKPAASRAESDGLCFFDMLVHLTPDAIPSGVFRSQYWTRLVPLLEQSGRRTTWMHTFFRHRDVPSVPDALALLDRFNGASGTQHHVLLDSQRSPAVLLSAAGTYARIAWQAFALRSIRNDFRPAGSAFDFWPLYRANWRSSLAGRYAIRNCLNLALFSRALRRLPRQSAGIYIQENQPWEIALVEAWRAAGHGLLVGVPHTSVRFWDLRYFYDRREYGPRDAAHVPQPDVIAVNGPAMRAACLEGGVPAGLLTEVEALRFLHLTNAAAAAPRPANGLRVLICGDNTRGSNEKMLRLVAEASRQLPPAARYVFKPHKAAPLDAGLNAGFPLEVRDGDLAQMLRECDIVLTGHVTSAAVDAYGLGVPVASLLDGRSLNGSPLRGKPGVRYFATAGELIEILRDPGAAGPREELFALDEALPRWQALIRRRPAPPSEPAPIRQPAS